MEPCSQLDEQSKTREETHDQMMERWMQDPEFRELAEQARAKREFFAECVQARKRAGLTQKDIAKHMGTTESAISRLESYHPGRKSVPKLDTLQKYAEALGCKLVLKLEPVRKVRRKA
jgi:ribosome-binding protein aMBF1 (putative translation factor)